MAMGIGIEKHYYDPFSERARQQCYNYVINNLLGQQVHNSLKALGMDPNKPNEWEPDIKKLLGKTRGTARVKRIDELRKHIHSVTAGLKNATDHILSECLEPNGNPKSDLHGRVRHRALNTITAMGLALVALRKKLDNVESRARRRRRQ